jgi:type III secretory pathway component EscT
VTAEPGGSVISAVARAFTDGGVDLAAVGLAWARLAPTVALVPAFGLRALPATVRGVLGLMLALCIFPATAGAAAHGDQPWAVLAVENVVRGIPLALAAAIPLWAATMAGGVVDSLRGAQDTLSFVTIEGRATPLGVPFAMLASILFLQGGGPARIALSLATHDVPAHPIVAASHDLVGGIGMAVALAGPLLAAAVVLEIAGALVSRASSPAQVHTLIAPLRTLALVGLTALVMERFTVVLSSTIR